ncbi:MAG: hypothetical protein J7601_10795 [Chloroflexi bacterium]|nr:hypothetical protein [Chloroflexota bacterium]
MSLTWTNERVKLRDLKPWEHNPRQITKRAAQRLLDSWRDYGQVQLVVVGPDNEVYDGHQRLSALKAVYGEDYELDVRRASRALTDDERRRLVVLLHSGATGHWDWDALAGWEAQQLIEWGLDEDTLNQWRLDIAGLSSLLDSEQANSECGAPDANPANSPYRTIKVCFESEEAVKSFAELVGQNITAKTKSIWFPSREDG